ncbi:MAG: hypothetical protein IIA17_10885 [candidate division Zixibacteria bacterium]|nr:hypothetical protein [candidate division Zixibacteria bacterium]
MRKLTYQYDKSADVLYAIVGEPEEGIFEEVMDGIYIRLNKLSRKPEGFVIVNYSQQKSRGKTEKIPHFTGVKIPY